MATRTPPLVEEAPQPRGGVRDLAARAGRWAPAAGRGRRAAGIAATGAVAVGLFLGYLQMARVFPTNSDGASVALQAWDLLHGNILLSGWTLADLSFYSTELMEHALVESVVGLSAEAVHISAALTYTLLVLLAAAVARGRATGREAVLRIGVVAAVLLAPALAGGYLTLLSVPDHTGTGVPLLLTWLVVERRVRERDGAEEARWWVPVAVAALLAWGQIGDPLVAYAGALALAVVSGWRIVRGAGPAAPPWRRRLTGPDARLLLAAVVSVVLAAGFVRLVRAAGGFSVYPAAIDFSPVSQWPGRAVATARGAVAVYGGYLPDAHNAWQLTVGLLHLVGLAAVGAAGGAVLYRAVLPGRARAGQTDAGRPHPPAADRTSQLLAAGILINLGAYLVSTLPADIHGDREIAAVLSLGAALAGRVCGSWLLRVRAGQAVLAGVTLVMCVSFAVQSATADGRVANAIGQPQADWLVAHGYRYGLGTYWNASSVSLASHGRVRVAPVTGGGRLGAYHWESRAEWYDPARHDARFVLLDLRTTTPANVQRLAGQFGPPVAVQHFGVYGLLLIYDHNILADLTRR
jgi:hypothetical protein